MQISTFKNRMPRRRGAVVVMVGVSLMTLMVFASFAVDVGYICALTAEAQDNADAGCLAGASAIHQGDYHNYKYRALDLIAQNQKYQGYNSLKDQVVEIGRWDTATATFSALAEGDEDSKGNAVRVVAKRNQTPLFFASVMGHNTTDVWREAVAMVRPTCGGVWGLDEVFVPGNVLVDSYDSTEGAYSAGSAYENGDVCSNGPLTVTGSIEIHGDLLGNGVIEKGGMAIITGYKDTLEDPIAPPNVDFGDIAINNDNGSIGLTDNGLDPFPGGLWNLSIKANDNLTIAGGRYYFDEIGFSAAKGTKVPGSVTVTGPTEIYVAGSIGLTAQGTFNTLNNPHDVTIYVMGPTVSIVGQAKFYGSIIAPNAGVQLAGNADMFGALIGMTVKMTGSFNFHVDESLPVVHSLKKPPQLVR
jgi:hypothetical protein